MSAGRDVMRTVGRWLSVIVPVAVMMLFWNSPLLWPLKIFVVLLHELSHLLALVLTGGHPSAISLSPEQGGLMVGTGGWRLLVLNAGYLGSLIWGLALLAIANRTRMVPIFLRVMGLGLGLATVVWMRPVLGFGFFYGMAVGILLFALGARISAVAGAALLRVVGLFSCLYAVIDIQLDVLTGRGGVSDASMLADLTHIPAMVWGVGWCLLALTILYLFRRTVVGG
ncbi:MAG: M50 family metallopeptidase [Myxococcota bacterium]|nr:M50 family metallopeptidase [Myxococcota bacterium]